MERSFAHLYETGGMRRTHLRRHGNILKRLLIDAAAFNLGLVMRKIGGCGTPRVMEEALLLLLALLCTAPGRSYLTYASDNRPT